MPFLRVIPSCLLLNNKLVKGKNFKNFKNVGSPVTTINAFESQKADEIFIIDLDAYKLKKAHNYKILNKISEVSSTPITYGGGIRKIEDVKKIFDNGADKIFLNSILLEEFKIVNEISKIYGNQSVVGGINIHLINNKFFILEDKTKKIDPIHHLKYLENIGIAEIKITYVHLEGTRKGIEIEYSKKIKSSTTLPCIFEGGIGNLDHIEEFFFNGLESISLGTILNFSDYNIVKIKKHLIEKNYKIRF